MTYDYEIVALGTGETTRVYTMGASVYDRVYALEQQTRQLAADLETLREDLAHQRDTRSQADAGP